MRQVVKYSIRQSVFINVVFIILLVVGYFCLRMIPVENMPNVDIGRIFVHTVYYGTSADDVEQLVTAKIEDALDGMEYVEYIQSHSYRNFSSVEVKFIDDSNYKDLYDELRFRALNAKNELPAGADEPTFVYLDTHAWMPVIVANITGEIPRHSLKLYADELKSKIMTIPNVRNVDISGEYDEEFHISVDPAKLRRFGITFYQVAEAIRSANTKIPTGRFRMGETEYMLDAGSKLRSQKEALEIVVRRDGDSFIRVRDLVTSARMRYRDPNEIPSVNGENTIRLLVIKEEAGNAVTICEQVKQVAKTFETNHAKDGLEIVFNRDSTIEINESVTILGGNLKIGLCLVFIILSVTLGIRNAFWAAIGIPFSFLCAVNIMWVTGESLNTISLFSFVLVTGIMVDDAVIIIENVYRHIQMGKTKMEAIVDGAGEVMLPVIASAMTTVFAFLPMLIMSGSTGEFFSVIPKTVTFALIASLLEALLILPIHLLDWGPEPKKWGTAKKSDDPFQHLRSGIFAPIWKIYHALLEILLKHKFLTFTSVFILFAVSVAMLGLSVSGIVPLIKVKFFPGNYFRYHVAITAPVGTSIEKMDTVVRDMSKYIMSLGEGQAQSASGAAGYYEDEDYSRHSGHNYGEIIVTLPDEDVRNFPENPKNDPMLHLEFIRKKIKDHVESEYGEGDFHPTVKIFEESDGPPTGKAVNIRVTAITMDVALKAADTIMEFMRKSPDLKDLVDLDDNRPSMYKTMKYIPKQEAVFEYGLSTEAVTGLVAGALNGYPAGEFRAVDEEVDLMVRLARKDDEANPTDAGLGEPGEILNVPIVEHSASPVLLRDLVDLEFAREPNVRSRYKGSPTITVTADIKEGSKLSAAAVKVAVTEYFEKNPERFGNVTLSHGGEYEATSRSYMSLAFAFVIAVMLIYLVLSSQFNDYFQPLIIISAVPFALIGVVMGLFLTRTFFTIGSFLAIVGLAGVAVNNSLLMIEFMNTRVRAGKSLRDAVIEACAARMRPVLITTVTTLLGLLPMAVGFPKKSISWAPMAMSFVSGLAASTILALLVVPVEYEFLERIRCLFRKDKHEQEPPELPV